MKNKIVSAILITGIYTSILSGCGNVYSNGPVLKVNDQGMSVGTAMMLLRIGQAGTFEQNEQLRKYYGLESSSVYWDDEVDTEDNTSTDITVKTRGDSYKQGAIESLKTQMLIREHISEFENDALTEEDNTNIKNAAAQFIKDNENEDFIKKNQITEASVKEYLELYTMFNRVEKDIESKADTNVSDEEAMQTSVACIQVSKGDDTDHAKEHIQNVYKKLGTYNGLAGIDLKTIAKEESEDISVQSYTFDKNDTSTLPENVMSAISNINDGDITDIIETDDSFYIVRMDAKEDKKATETKKEEIIQDRKDKLFKEKIESWEKESDIDINAKFWNSVKVKDNDKYIIKNTESEDQKTDTE